MLKSKCCRSEVIIHNRCRENLPNESICAKCGYVCDTVKEPTTEDSSVVQEATYKTIPIERLGDLTAEDLSAKEAPLTCEGCKWEEDRELYLREYNNEDYFTREGSHFPKCEKCSRHHLSLPDNYQAK